MVPQHLPSTRAGPNDVVLAHSQMDSADQRDPSALFTLSESLYGLRSQVYNLGIGVSFEAEALLQQLERWAEDVQSSAMTRMLDTGGGASAEFNIKWEQQGVSFGDHGGGGDCFYRSSAAVLDRDLGITIEAQALRGKIADWLAENRYLCGDTGTLDLWERLLGLHGCDRQATYGDWEGFLQKTRTVGNWCEEVHVVALANISNVKVQVFSSTGATCTYMPQQPNSESRATALAHIAEVHWGSADRNANAREQ